VIACVLTGLLVGGLTSRGLFAAEAAESMEENTVSLDDAGPKPTPTSTATPTPAPTATFTIAPTEVPAPSVAATPESKLDEPGFDAKARADEAREEDGLVLIAPGAASPEESLETFGIDSPFNWKEKRRRARLEPKSGSEEAASGEEGIELNAPETSDLKEKVAVETGEGRTISKSEDYDAVERAGWVVGKDEFAFDAVVSREKSGRYSFTKGAQIYMQMQPGRQVYPGSVYSIFRNFGPVAAGTEKLEMGHLVRAVGVARVVRVDSESIIARLEKSYMDVKVGDGMRLRDPDRARHFATLRQGATDSGGDVRARVAAIEDAAPMARAGNVIYLDGGSLRGVAPGMKLTLFREAAIAPPEEGPDDRDTATLGRLGECVVVSVQRGSATARVLKSMTNIRVGDKVRYR
jgi:hypothetical protein